MSVHCRIAHPTLLLKALCMVHVHRDCWATVTFGADVVVLHVDGTDLVCTATATLPRAVFADYCLTGQPRFAVHVAHLIDAMLLLGPEALVTRTACVALAYRSEDARLVVDVLDEPSSHALPCGLPSCVACGTATRDADSANRGSPVARATRTTATATARRTLRSTLLTRPAMHTVLDLHFDDAPLRAQATLHSDALRDVIADIVFAQCPRAALTVDALAGVHVRGEGGPFGEVDVLLPRHCSAIVCMRRCDGGDQCDGGGGGGDKSNDAVVCCDAVTLPTDGAAVLHSAGTARAADDVVGNNTHTHNNNNDDYGGGSGARDTAASMTTTTMTRTAADAHIGRTCVSTSHLAAACGARVSALPVNRARNAMTGMLAAGVDAFFSFGTTSAAGAAGRAAYTRMHTHMNNNNNNNNTGTGGGSSSSGHHTDLYGRGTNMLRGGGVAAEIAGGSGAPLPATSVLADAVEQLTLQVNARRQLSVVSVQQKGDVRVTVTVVLMPLVQ